MNKQIRKAIFAGSFDPITNGHLDLIERASKLFDELQIGVLYNPNKKGLFTFEERVKLIEGCTKPIDNIKVVSFDGLLVDYCEQNNIQTTQFISPFTSIPDFFYNDIVNIALIILTLKE